MGIRPVRISGRMPILRQVDPPQHSLNRGYPIDGIDCEVVYAAATPQVVAGVFQVNVRVPDMARQGDALPLVVTVSGVSIQGGVTIALK